MATTYKITIPGGVAPAIALVKPLALEDTDHEIRFYCMYYDGPLCISHFLCNTGFETEVEAEDHLRKLVEELNG